MDRKKLYLTAAGIGAGLLVRSFLRKPGSSLYSKVVLITGSAGGLGLALAREFAAEGCRVALAGNDPNELDAGRRKLDELGTSVFTTRCDVTNLAQVDGAAEAVLNHYGRIDILINNAGRIAPAGLREMSLEDFESAMDLVFWGIVYPTRAVLPHMLERRSGRMVNVVSEGAHAAPHLLPRDCAKFAAIGFSEGLRNELLPEGISVVTIVPPATPPGETRTARQIVTATLRGEANGLGPGGRKDIGRVVQDLLSADSGNPRSHKVSVLGTIGRLAAR